LIVAGGISSNEEIAELDRMGADSVVGMALYLGKLNLETARPS
jgi:phosphoribosylformimino-5-aminoimidazole carboxamide ribonucleotide (ProFAR) isomerase